MLSKSVLFCMLQQGCSITRHRLLYSSAVCLSVEKSLLAKLRKKTGFSLSQCRKALADHDNDFDQAEAWIRKEAQKQGWSRAMNLSGRPVTQGLVSVCVENNIGAVVEVNCETDFVARNSEFQDLVCRIAKEYLSFAQKGEISDSLKLTNNKQEIESIQTSEGKTLADLVALAIGKIGENMTISRGSILRSSPDSQILSYCHPSTADDPKNFGKYASLVIVKNLKDVIVGRGLGAHVIAMNPTEIGKIEDDPHLQTSEESEASPESEKSPHEASSTSTSEGSDSSSTSEEEEDVEVTQSEQKIEPRLIFQDFLQDPEQRVIDVLKEHEVEILDFIRYECGETAREAAEA